MSNGWMKNVRKVVPYTPGEQPKELDVVKLNTNENPYPPAPAVSAILSSYDTSTMKKYPDPNVSALRDSLAEYSKVNKDMVFVGVGSDDVLGMSFLTFFAGEKEILFPDITYSFYDVWASLFGIPYKNPKLDENFRIKKEDYLVPNGGIIITNPNAPTSIEMELSEIEEIIAKNPDSVVIVDEAYVDFGGQSALPLVWKYDNLLVVRTYSKSRSMAGMRIGYAIGQKDLIAALNAVKHSYNSYTMSSVAIACGCASLADEEYFNETRNKIIATREKYTVVLEELGFSVLPSSTNFLFATHKSVPAKEIFDKLRERRVFVRYFNKERIDNYLRITIGTEEEMEKLISNLKEIL